MCAAIAIGAAVLWAIFLVSRFHRIPPSNYSEMNLRIWTTGAGLTLTYLRDRGRSGDRTTYRFLAESEAGERRAGWASVSANAIDPRSERIEIVWERFAPAIRAPRHLHDDPLWDDGLDGGPGGRAGAAPSRRHRGIPGRGAA